MVTKPFVSMANTSSIHHRYFSDNVVINATLAGSDLLIQISATQWNFLTPVLIVLVITTITITIHSYLSARTNPVNSLKAE